MNDMLTETEFWRLVIRSQEHQMILVNPDLESRVKTWVAVADLSEFITVIASPVVPINLAYCFPKDMLHPVNDIELHVAEPEPLEPDREPWWRGVLVALRVRRPG